MTEDSDPSIRTSILLNFTCLLLYVGLIFGFLCRHITYKPNSFIISYILQMI